MKKQFTEEGKFLKAAREKSRMTQAELAEELGDVHVQFVSNWERGLCQPPMHKYRKLIKFLKINEVDLRYEMLRDAENQIRFLPCFRRQ